MTLITNIRGVIRTGSIELRDQVELPEGCEVTISIDDRTAAAVPGQLDPKLEALIGAFADIGDEVDEFNRWYREMRQADTVREILPE